MSFACIAPLIDRGVVRVTGADAEKLLQGVITNDMDLLASQPAIHAALLTPQGKILFEFFVVKAADGFLLETGRDKAPELVRRLNLYRLRAKAAIDDASGVYRVFASWGDAPRSLGESVDGVSFTDPRLAALGLRILVGAEQGAGYPDGEKATADAYHAHRITLGVPEGGKDYALGDAFPHEADLDLLHGVSFSKGCYVGQEVVSRMQNRATVRKRVVPIEGDAPLTSGAEVRAGEAVIGTVGSVTGRKALALVRLDRAAEAKARGQALAANGVAVTLRKPDWAKFTLALTESAEAP
jgi:hypothetical protein